jgi:hypothetical protein
VNAETLHQLLTEVQERLEHPLEHLRPVEVALKDPVPSESRPRKVGVIRKARFDIDSDFYGWLMTLPENCVLKGIVWMEEGSVAVEPAKKKTKPTKGPYGKFWEEMFLEGVIGRADFQQWTGVQPGLDKWQETVRALFGKESLTEVSHEMMIEWLLKEAGPDRLDNLRKKIQSVADSLKPDFPEGQYFSPFDLGAKAKPKSEDQQFIEENQLP